MGQETQTVTEWYTSQDSAALRSHSAAAAGGSLILNLATFALDKWHKSCIRQMTQTNERLDKWHVQFMRRFLTENAGQNSC